MKIVMWSRLPCLLAALMLAACAATPGKVTQEEPVPQIDAPTAMALDGYDTVAYFAKAEPALGDEAYEHVWRGARWRFASEANRDAFVADPERYAPQYGGYCAYAMARGAIARGDPLQWAVVKDKLYVNNNAFAKSLWDRDRPGHIIAGDANWPLMPKLPLPADGQLQAH